MIEFSAVILAGGRARRLGGIDKTSLVFEGATLLEHALASVVAARTVVVVGGDSGIAETPRFSGPAAATIAGLDALPRPRARFTVVLAADQPRVASAVPLLLEALAASPFTGGIVAVDEHGRRQPLLAVYNTAALALAGAEARSRSTLENLGMFALIAPILTIDLRLPPGLCADVDTHDDARDLGLLAEALHA